MEAAESERGACGGSSRQDRRRRAPGRRADQRGSPGETARRQPHTASRSADAARDGRSGHGAAAARLFRPAAHDGRARADLPDARAARPRGAAACRSAVGEIAREAEGDQRRAPACDEPAPGAVARRQIPPRAAGRLSESGAGRADRTVHSPHAPVRAGAHAGPQEHRYERARARGNPRPAAAPRPARRVRRAAPEHGERERADPRMAPRTKGRKCNEF